MIITSVVDKRYECGIPLLIVVEEGRRGIECYYCYVRTAGQRVVAAARLQ
jgi:hypothetical protein